MALAKGIGLNRFVGCWSGLLVPALLTAGYLTLAISGCADLQPPAGPQHPPAETTVWDVIHVHRQPVGHQALTLRRANEGDELIRDARATAVLNLQRFGQATRQQMELTSRESADGQLMSLGASVQSGGGQVETHGRRQGNQLLLEIRSAGKAVERSITLPTHCGGYFAVEWSLLNEPMQPGEQRQLHAVVPVLDQVAQITLVARSREPVDLLGETRELLRIDQQVLLPGGETIESVAWVTDDGQVLKTSMSGLQQVSYRVSREAALAASQEGTFDLGRFSTVRMSEPLRVTANTRRIRYRVRLAHDDPAEYFPNLPGQQVVSIDARTAEVTVSAVGPRDLTTSTDTPPDASDRSPSPMIQSDDARIRQMAEQIEQPAAGPWSRALAAERFVHEAISTKNLGTAFASAAEVAVSREGDCTEHAVLLAALCRAQGIPARVRVGLVYTPAEQGFAFHMWNEVWIENEGENNQTNGWMALDATAGQGGTGPTYLVLGRTNLASGDGMTAMLPVVEVMGQLAIEVVDQGEQRASPNPAGS
jgi:transglutaminase-like putative cysteine protease